MSCCPKSTLPSLAVKFVKAVARESVARVAGERLNLKEVLARQVICRSCEFNVGGRCEKCECFIVAKTVFVTEDCPEGWWDGNKVDTMEGLQVRDTESE
jgi:hypothetical protein